MSKIKIYELAKEVEKSSKERIWEKEGKGRRSIKA